MDKSSAWVDGWLAHKNNPDSDENPYLEDSQSRSFHQWQSGWCARFGACKHGEELPYDDAAFAD